MSYPRRAFLSAAGVTVASGCLGIGGPSGDGDGDTGNGTTDGGATTETTAGNDTASGTPDEATPTRSDVSLLLNWKPSGLHVPYYAARAEGFYEAEGLTLSSIESGQGSDFSAKQVGLGNTPFAVTSADQVLNVNSRELSPRSVGVVMQRSPVVLFATRESLGGEFTGVEQLRGKRLGTGPGMVRLLSTLLLEEAGVREEVELVDTGFDTVQRLLTGDIDAAGGVFGDVVDARHQGATVDSVPVAAEIPSYGHVIATPPSLGEEHPETVRAFLRATAHGAAWATNNPEAATDHLVEAVPALSESRDRQRDKWELMSREFVLSGAVREQGWGWSQSDPWATMHETLTGADSLGGEVDPASVWTNDYLDLEATYVGSYAEQVGD
ncbi:ABC transporter substrate-binding protein [Halomarina litorea]|uniref:ABC transporter substrate-binding protein n=1 Tax=Halomarina litorea TaxID=2961595 RepID=UPI0020C5626F|nr:ABC transporter substrate-binding protein [Halomarina sp. BCD28]